MKGLILIFYNFYAHEGPIAALGGYFTAFPHIGRMTEMGLVRNPWRRAVKLRPHNYRLTGIGGTAQNGHTPIPQADLLLELAAR
jgi:hypothetical protein